jgi:hypothetical protein
LVETAEAARGAAPASGCCAPSGNVAAEAGERGGQQRILSPVAAFEHAVMRPADITPMRSQISISSRRSLDTTTSAPPRASAPSSV